MKVAREYNIPKSVLWRRCQREGVLRGEARRCYNYSPDDIDQARQMLLGGRPLSTIVKDTKVLFWGTQCIRIWFMNFFCIMS